MIRWLHFPGPRRSHDTLDTSCLQLLCFKKSSRIVLFDSLEKGIGLPEFLANLFLLFLFSLLSWLWRGGGEEIMTWGRGFKYGGEGEWNGDGMRDGG
jgi:hypothetical protein